VADALASEFDPLDVAAAAVKLAHQTQQGDSTQDEEHIPSAEPRAPRERGPDAPPRQPHKAAGGKGRPPARGGTMVRVYVSAGRMAGLRPADLVGAIANEAGVSSREIGAIEIEDRYSLVEVSSEIADDAIRALRGTSIRGQRVVVRKDQPKRSTRTR
jgi:ATP-dependent RNA helicase DeaD